MDFIINITHKNNLSCISNCKSNYPGSEHEVTGDPSIKTESFSLFSELSLTVVELQSTTGQALDGITFSTETLELVLKISDELLLWPSFLIRDSFSVEIYFESFRFVVEEKAWKLPEGCTGEDKQVAGALQDSGRSSRELNIKDRKKYNAAQDKWYKKKL